MARTVLANALSPAAFARAREDTECTSANPRMTVYPEIDAPS